MSEDKGIYVVSRTVGEEILKILREKELSVTAFANRLGAPKEFAQDVIDGNVRVVPEIAEELERVLGVPSATWIALDNAAK